MQLKEAFRKLYLDSNKEQLFDPFYVYSFLSDYVYDDYKSKEFIKLYYKVTTKINIFEYLIKNNLEDGLKLLKSKQKKYDKFFTFLDFKKCVFVSALAINPNFVVKKKTPKKVSVKTPAKTINKPKTKPQTKPQNKQQNNKNNKPKANVKIQKNYKQKILNVLRTYKNKVAYLFGSIQRYSLLTSSYGLMFRALDCYSFQSYFLQFLFLLIGAISLTFKDHIVLNIFLFILYGLIHVSETTLEVYFYNKRYVRFLRRGLLMNLFSFVSYIIFIILFSISDYLFITILPLVLSTIFLIFYVRYTDYL